MKRVLILFLVMATQACTTTQIQQTLGTVGSVLGADTPLTTGEVSSGLKEALNLGITKGATILSQKDGYFKSVYKILLPEEARNITNKLQGIPGFSELEQTILEKINRGAEDAAKKAAPIFADAIKQMSFSDAMNILMGDKDAATLYLKQATFEKLFAEFNPVIVESLDKFQARKVWSDAFNAYNKIPLVNKQVETDLGTYVTNQALTGLFQMVEKEERNIRKNVSARTSDLLKKVFAKQDT